MINFPEVQKSNLSIVICGVGANGSYVTQNIAQLIASFERSRTCTVVLADPDVVEKKNLTNQYFVDSDVGSSKSNVLATRYSSIYKAKIFASETFSKAYVQTTDDLKQLFKQADMMHRDKREMQHILIGCVDNFYSRKVMHEYFESETDLIYIDVGNTGIKRRDYFDSSVNFEGFDGQVVVGIKYGGVEVSRDFAGYFPDDINRKDNPADISCQAAAVSQPQRIFTNKMSALAVTSVMNDIFAYNGISKAFIQYNAFKMEMRSLDIDS